MMPGILALVFTVFQLFLQGGLAIDPMCSRALLWQKWHYHRFSPYD